ncbi:hypothetical protein AB1Y20_005596 [Prymnesium parvum]|uniref:Glycosyltransferase 61 catalytic domain-containing protein n=1 Tax=Prymnesium parvum TaxID=97485 RepID=A0AB34J4L4_PRYPA
MPRPAPPSPPEAASLACTSSSCGVFSTFAHAAHLNDEWAVTLFNHLCFLPSPHTRRSRWVLPYSAAQPNATRYRVAAFQRFPLTFVPSSAWEAAPLRRGVTFLADLRHAGAGPPGIAHFAKRLLRLHGMLRHADEYALPAVSRIVFPATTALQLRTHWPRALLRLVAPRAALIPAEALLAERQCFAHVATASREDTYFTRADDAAELRRRAYALAAVRRARRCGGVRACYFQRAAGGRANSGSWEGGPRTVANWREVVQAMGQLLRGAGRVEMARVNSSMTLAQQVEVFSSCDILCSVHGSQNANVMFMREGAAFMEINPYKFFYSSYERLAQVAGLLYLPSRDNRIHTEGMDAKGLALARHFERTYGGRTDDWCQQDGKCRKLARNFPTYVNLTTFEREFARGLRHVAARVKECD